MAAHQYVQLSLVGPQAAVRRFFDERNVSVGDTWPFALVDGSEIKAGFRADGSWTMGFPPDPDPVAHSVDPLRGWFHGSVWDEDWVSDEAVAARYPELSLTVIRGGNRYDASLPVSIRTFMRGKLLFDDTFAIGEDDQVMLFLPEVDALIPVGEHRQVRSIRSGQLGWAMRGRFTRWGHGGPFVLVNHAKDTATNRGKFEEMVRRATGTVTTSRFPQEVLTITRPAGMPARRTVVVDLPWDAKVHLMASLSRWRPWTMPAFQRFLWDLADQDTDEPTRFRYAADIAGTAQGTTALLAVWDDLTGATAAERERVSEGFSDDPLQRDEELEAEFAEERRAAAAAAGVPVEEPSLAPTAPGVDTVNSLAELALRMAWLRHGLVGPMPTLDPGPALGLRAGQTRQGSAPTASTWAELETLIGDHLSAGGSEQPQTITVVCEAPGARFVQFLCTAGEDLAAEVVGPAFIEAGPEFFDQARLRKLADLGFEPDAYGGENFGRGYEAEEWLKAAHDSMVVFRDVLDVAPAEVTVMVG